MQVVELNHVALKVADLEASTDFYGQVLGLRPLDRPAFSFPGAWFALGGQELHLIGGEDHVAEPGQPRGNHFALRVDDVEAAAERLRGENVAFRGPNPRPDGALQVFLSDPDGHVIELCQL